MTSRLDGWVVLAQMAARRRLFAASETTATLVSTLLVRTQLTQGVSSARDLETLRDIIGTPSLAAVVQDLAGYEALRILNNMGLDISNLDERTPDGARRHLLGMIRGDSVPQTQPDQSTSVENLSVRTLRRHQSLGARRIRLADDGAA